MTPAPITPSVFGTGSTCSAPSTRSRILGKTYYGELLRTLEHARASGDVGCVILTGNGPSEKNGKWAFCTGGDQSAHDGNYDGRGTIGLPMEELHTAIRDVPKPVIALVAGYAIGGGHVLEREARSLPFLDEVRAIT